MLGEGSPPSTPRRKGSVHEIEIDNDEGTISHAEAMREKKYFYAGTVSGWCDKHQTVITTLAAIVAIIVISAIVAGIYVHANENDDQFDDEDCWPFSCPSSFYTSDVTTGFDDDFYWEHYYNNNLPSNSEWAFRLPSPTNRNLYAISHFVSDLHNYHFVAVGDDSTILASVNGTDWQLLPPIQPHVNLVSVAYSADTFYVETRTGDCFQSEDLHHWSKGAHSFSSGIASSDTISVGVEHNTVWLRDISLNWIRVIVRDADKVLDVAYGNGVFVLIGTTHLESQPDAQYASIWISETGISWESYIINDNILQNSDQLQISLARTTEGRGIFLAFADRLYTSGTGEVWLPVPETPWLESAAPSSLSCAISGYCVALSQGGDQTVVSQTSDYGLTWSSKIVGATFYAIADNNEATFTGVGDKGNVIQGIATEETHRINWNQVAPKFGEEISSLIFADSKFVASSEKYATFQSTDGIEWTKADSPSLSFIAHGNDIFAGSFSNSVALDLYVSGDTEDWLVVDSYDGFYQVAEMIFDGHQFVLTGRTCDACTQFDDDDDDSDEVYESVFLTSPDGRTWDSRNTTGANSYFVDFDWDSIHNCYYAIGADGSMYNTDSIDSWSELYIEGDVNCKSVAVNQRTGLAMAVFEDVASGDTYIATSDNCGSHWTTISCSCSSCGSIDTISYHYQQNMFYMGGSEILRTADGSSLQWASTAPVSLDSMTKLSLGNNALLVLSEAAIISASLDSITFNDTC